MHYSADSFVEYVTNTFPVFCPVEFLIKKTSVNPETVLNRALISSAYQFSGIPFTITRAEKNRNAREDDWYI